MPIPLIVWGAFALGSALGIGGTMATTDAAEDFGGAVSDGADSLNRLTKTILLAGTAYVAYQNIDTIKKFIGGK